MQHADGWICVNVAKERRLEAWVNARLGGEEAGKQTPVRPRVPLLLPPWTSRTRTRSGRPSSSSASTRTPSVPPPPPPSHPADPPRAQAKTIELMGEVNHCIADLYRANENIRAAASLVDKYRRNVRYNIANAEAAAEPAGPRPSSRMQD
jgi:hypothetical protein